MSQSTSTVSSIERLLPRPPPRVRLTGHRRTALAPPCPRQDRRTLPAKARYRDHACSRQDWEPFLHQQPDLASIEEKREEGQILYPFALTQSRKKKANASLHEEYFLDFQRATGPLREQDT